MTAEAYAKVNLTLEVYGTRPDGYHALRSVVLPISLSDTLTFEPAAPGEASTDTGYGDDDLIAKAARAVRAAAGPSGDRLPGVYVRVDKRIPAGGGLGGGSADAAATLLALNAAWELGLSVEELAAIGAGVGSDVPALVMAQSLRAPVLMEGRGEIVSPLGDGMLEALGMAALLGRGSKIVLANPGVASSTAEAYARCRPRRGEPSGGLLPVNDLQQAACSLHPEIAAALAALSAAGAEHVAMSGSGSTVFGFAGGDAEARRIAAEAEAAGCRTWTAEPLRGA